VAFMREEDVLKKMLYLISSLNTLADQNVNSPSSAGANNTAAPFSIQKINYLNEDIRRKMSSILLEMLNENHSASSSSGLSVDPSNKSLVTISNSSSSLNSSLSSFLASITSSGKTNFSSVNDFSMLFSNMKTLLMTNKIQSLSFADCYYISVTKMQKFDVDIIVPVIY
jgi:hypothetical protein